MQIKLTTMILSLILLVCSPVMAESESSENQQYPNIVGVRVENVGDNQFEFLVTVSSEYATPERYVNAIRIMSQEGEVLVEHEVAHYQRGEQPFTRGVAATIPEGVKTVVIQARDLDFGYGGETMEVDLPGR